MKQAILLLGLLLLAIMFPSCGDDDNPIGPGSDVYFSLGVSHSGLYRDGELTAIFTTTDQGVIPSVTVGGMPMTRWIPYGQSLIGMIDGEISYSSTIEFSISARGRTSTGVVSLPPSTGDPRCNGLALLEGDTVPVPGAAEYEFTWDGGAYDFTFYRALIYFDGERIDELLGNITESAVTLEPVLADEIRMILTNINGILPESGVEITMDCAYGKGYVFASSSSWYGTVEIIPGGHDPKNEVLAKESIPNPWMTRAGATPAFPIAPEDLARRLEEAVASTP